MEPKNNKTMQNAIITPKRAKRGFHTVNIVVHEKSFDLFISGAFMKVGVIMNEAANCYTFAWEDGEVIDIKYKEGEWSEDLKEVRIITAGNEAFMKELIGNYEYLNARNYFEAIAELI